MGPTARSTGSLNTAAPAGIEIVGLPLNVSTRSDSGAMADPTSRTAT